ncbi:MAG: DUF4166 domain-containing protein [Pseudomonadota bacterium]
MTVSPIRAALDQEWPQVAQCLRIFHAGPGLYAGRADIDRGRNPLARCVASLFGFPPAGRDVPVTVAVEALATGERWTRTFGDRSFQSHICPAGPGCMQERFGPCCFRVGVELKEGAISLTVLSGRIGPLPFPRVLLPSTVATERAVDGRFHFDISLAAPLIGLIVHYRGWLEPVDGPGSGMARPPE